jgi:hypothetical protein
MKTSRGYEFTFVCASKTLVPSVFCLLFSVKNGISSKPNDEKSGQEIHEHSTNNYVHGLHYLWEVPAKDPVVLKEFWMPF